MHKDYTHIKAFALDMDGTLYDHLQHVIPSLWKAHESYIALHVPALRDKPLKETFWSYVKKHGSPHGGMEAEHGVNPHHYLKHIHNFDLSPQKPDPEVTAGLARLHGEKIVFTNAPADFAHRLTAQIGVKQHLHGIFAIEDMGLISKPAEEAYYAFFAKHSHLKPAEVCMVEDTADNLVVPHRLGMKTVHLHGGKPPVSAPHIHHSYPTINHWLREVAPAPAILPAAPRPGLFNKIK